MLISIFLNICPEVGLQDHMIALFLVFKRILILFLVMTVQIYLGKNLAKEIKGLYNENYKTLLKEIVKNVNILVQLMKGYYLTYIRKSNNSVA
jgi:hypothetical protein